MRKSPVETTPAKHRNRVWRGGISPFVKGGGYATTLGPIPSALRCPEVTPRWRRAAEICDENANLGEARQPQSRPPRRVGVRHLGLNREQKSRIAPRRGHRSRVKSQCHGRPRPIGAGKVGLGAMENQSNRLHKYQPLSSSSRLRVLASTRSSLEGTNGPLPNYLSFWFSSPSGATASQISLSSGYFSTAQSLLLWPAWH